jgi:hypothetical protein
MNRQEITMLLEFYNCELRIIAERHNLWLRQRQFNIQGTVSGRLQCQTPNESNSDGCRRLPQRIPLGD